MTEGADVQHNFVENWKTAWGLIKQDLVTWILICIVGWVAVGCGMWGGYHYCYLKAKQGQKLSWQDVLWPFKSGKPVDLFIGGMIGMVAYPFLAAMWGFNTALQVDRGMAFGEAMTEGKKETGKSYVSYLIFFFVILLPACIPLIGIPIAFGALMEAFSEKFGPLQSNALTTDPPA